MVEGEWQAGLSHPAGVSEVVSTGYTTVAFAYDSEDTDSKQVYMLNPTLSRYGLLAKAAACSSCSGPSWQQYQQPLPQSRQ